MKSIHIVSESSFSVLLAKAEKINKKAKKMVVYLSIIGDKWATVNNVTTHKLEVLLYVPLGFGEAEAKADILAIKYRDYADEAAPVIVHAVEDGVELDKTWFSDDFSCHHCGTHRNRKIAYIVRMKRTKEVVQVGRACLTEVLGIAPERFMTLLKYFENFEDALETGEKDDESDPEAIHEYHAPSWYRVDDFLGTAVHVTAREGGYVRTRDDYGDRNPNSTFAMVSREIVNSDELSKDERRTASSVKEWYLALDKKDEFGLNVQNILKKEFCSEANAALLAFLPNAYSKHLAYEAEKKRKEELTEKLSNEFVGEVGKRLRNIPVQVVGCHTFMVQGYTYYEQEHGKEMAFYDFVDAHGNILSWKTDKFAYAKGMSYRDNFSCLCEFFDESGNVVKDAPSIVLSGTVKEFNEYKGTKKTILTRCRWTPQIASDK